MKSCKTALSTREKTTADQQQLLKTVPGREGNSNGRDGDALELEGQRRVPGTSCHRERSQFGQRHAALSHQLTIINVLPISCGAGGKWS